MAEVYHSNIPAGAKRGATLLAQTAPLNKDQAHRILDHLDEAANDSTYAYSQALKASHLDGLSQLTKNLLDKAGKAGIVFTASLLFAATAGFGISVHEALSLLKEGQLSGDFSVGTVATANVIAAGLLGAISVEGVAGALRDFIKRDPDVADAYERLNAGAKPASGRAFAQMTPDEREKAKQLISLMSQLHAGNTPMLQADIRALIDTLNATKPQSFDSELESQIEMVRHQLLLEHDQVNEMGVGLAASPATTKAALQIDMT
ncbi:MAG: hypothetical protein IBX50_12115 [Marinospirillum sp.]|uniref:hypothetical protein n=1 Tax=Marinospirillum sp. TaxID=2183934 RepID=UPI0019F696D8|nr:hypothetical protein [Marinospirillum sp.]MBE0507441.1 hypothetical protein [Marinospirillum sp.]